MAGENRLLHDLLVRSADEFPENIAIRHEKEEISYKRLNLLSNLLSNCLIANGVRTGDRVGILMDKSIDAVLSIFGILKAGACYVPLDSLAPPERNRHIINDCSLKYLIASALKIPEIREGYEKTANLKSIFVLDISKKERNELIPGVEIFFKEDVFQTKRKVIKKEISGKNYAYILYTSGSTGTPKGVLISHKASHAFVDWAYKCFQVCCDDRVSSHAPFHFDLSIFDIFVTLKAGATICIIPQGISSFPRSLADFIEKEKISIWYSVPSVLINLALNGSLEKRDLPHLKKILFAGDVFPVKHLRKLMKAIPHTEYFNLYGPTETNVCTYYPIKNLPELNCSVPIGKPCNGTELFIINKEMELTETGQVGELCVSGPTLMEGYWNDREKTERVLIENPFSPEKNKEIYKTGDYASIDEGGYFIFHGRIDRMVKSRGYRIELGEIESVINNHPEINEVAVVAIPDDKIGNIVKAVIVLKKTRLISEKEIKQYCSTRLPLYMIPEIITFRKTLPRTSHSKVDRKKI